MTQWFCVSQHKTPFHSPLLFPQFLATLLALLMVMSDLLEGQINTRAEWRSATMGSGEQSVMTRGVHMTLRWPADNLVTLELVGSTLISNL